MIDGKTSQKLRRVDERFCRVFSSEVPDSHTELFSEALAAMLHMNEELIALGYEGERCDQRIKPA